MRRKNNLQEFYYFLQDLQQNHILPIKNIYLSLSDEVLNFNIEMKVQYNLRIFYEISADKEYDLNCEMIVKTYDLHTYEQLKYKLNLNTDLMTKNLLNSLNTLIKHYKLEK